MIKSIDTTSIHRICSSQVVVDLATAVKELVENAIDAGASVIEISLTEFGESTIEVHDNARGIDPEDFEGLAMKHHTSKINQFEDLANVASYGFRGEALNSLCELSESFSVITKRHEDTSAFQLKFDRMGRLSRQDLTTRETGTTVLIEKLFSTLPVRRAEFVRNIKKQYQKMLRIIQAYAVFATGIKFIMINTTNGVRQTVLSTQQTSQIENNICSVFGSKFLNSLQKFSSDIYNYLPGEYSIDEEEALIRTQEGSEKIGNVTGYISKIGLGIGRSDNDRQFVFCNGRPIDLPKMIKGVNEIWRKYEMKQKPAFIIDIRIKRDTVDVNLAPNKREVLIENEDLLIENVKEAVDKLYSVTRNTLQVNNNSNEVRKISSFANFTMPVANNTLTHPPITKLNESKSIAESKQIGDMDKSSNMTDEAKTRNEVLLFTQNSDAQKLPNQPIDPIPNPVTSRTSEVTDVIWASPTELNRLSQIPSTSSQNQQSVEVMEEWTPSPYTEIPWDICTDVFNPKKRELEPLQVESSISLTMGDSIRVKRHRQEALSLSSSIIPDNNQQENGIDNNVRIIEKNDFARMKVLGQFNLGFIIVELDGDLYILDQHACDEKYRFEGLQRSTKLHHQPLLKSLVVEMTANLESVVEDNMDIFEANGFQLQVNDNEPVGRRVSMISMPFSKGTQFGVNDVLELASMLCGEDGDDFYEGRMNKNYLSLRNDPVSQLLTGKAQDSSPSLSVPRILLPKIMTMFASRACRSAVMIGTALNKTEMKNIVQQMVSVEQPWNCPHGRPTMRHLFDIETFFANEAISDKINTENKGLMDDVKLKQLDNHLREAMEEDI